jgi:hypothetical protein
MTYLAKDQEKTTRLGVYMLRSEYFFTTIMSLKDIPIGRICRLQAPSGDGDH